jgi:hypothetical protein
MSTGSQADPEVRIAELKKRRDDIDAEIARIRAGEISLLDDTGLKDRFQQFLQLARELLTDFREVEHNFRTLDRRVREHIALWEGAKGALLEQIMGERDAIADSDQGKSFRAFWDFLMSQSRQEELSLLLEAVLALPPIVSMRPGNRLRRVHYDWLEAGEHTQRTVARLSEQLRRFLDDKAWLENRRIMDILHNVETQALDLRDDFPTGGFMPLDGSAALIELPLERALYRPPFRPLIAGIALDEGDAEIDTAILYAQVVVDWAELLRNIRLELQMRSQVTLGEVVERHPLRNGLAELVAYLQLAGEWPRILSIVAWRLKHPQPGIYLRQIDLPGVHSKFIEGHRGVLGELFDLVLPPEEIDATAIGSSGFCRRYGFQDKPLRVRFRILDPTLALLPTKSDQDITVTQATFARLELPVTKVFITENEINFLAFPDVPEAMVIFGAGYGFENLASVEWLRDRFIHYWGDINTHGFAILNQLRKFFPHVVSLLMDRETLMEHQALWGVEPSPETGALTRLTAEESVLYDQLRRDELGSRIRLEQERIGFEWLVGALGRV